MSQSSSNNSCVSKEQRQKLKKIFLEGDLDHSGDLDEKQLLSIFQRLGVPKSKEKVRKVLMQTETIRQGKLNYEEFEQLFSVARLLDVFHEMDRDGSDGIDINELKACFRKLGYRISNLQCEALFKQVDVDKSGKISFDEFQQFFQNIPLASLEEVAEYWTNSVIISYSGSDIAPIILTSGIPIWQTILAIGTGGVVSRTATAPLENLKIFAQTGIVLDTSAYTTSGMVAELRSLYASQGVAGLFAGNLTNCIRVFPTAGITTFCYIKLMSMNSNQFDSLESLYRFGSAATAALVANTLTYPLDMIRTRVTVAPENITIRECVTDIQASNRGISAFYTGLVPSLVATVPYVMIQCGGNDLIKYFYMENGVEITKPLLIGTGIFLGLVGQTVVYPIEVFRRRMQVMELQSYGLGNRAIAIRTWRSMRVTFRREGIRSLFAGIVPTYIKTVPAVAVFSYTANTMIDYFRENNKKCW